MRYLRIPVVFFFLCSTALAAFAGSPERPPNIIYIMADDLGYADIGVYGQTGFETPHLDRLARDGMKFTRHYTGVSVCAPARCVLMTGLHMGRAEVRGNRQDEPSGQMPIADETVTVAELLQDAGYVTGMIGKWGLGEPGTTGDPNRQGFDFFYGYTDQVLAHNYWPEFLWRNGEKEYLRNEVKYIDPDAWHQGLGSYSTKKVEYSNDLFTDEAVAFIERHRDTPFFLYLPYTIPHDNGEAPRHEQQEVPELGRFAFRDWLPETRGYAAMIERLDGYVGRIRAQVENLGLAEDTVIFFTSDNGPMVPDRNPHTAYFDSNGPLRGGKRDLYEGGIRVPMIAWWPGKIRAGGVTAHPSIFYDFLPTALDLAGERIDNVDTDGISYLPTLLGEEQPRHAFLYWEFHGPNKAQAVIRGKWKGVRNHVDEDPDRPVELYNLREDPGETMDLAEFHPAVAAELLELMRQAHTPDRLWPLFE